MNASQVIFYIGAACIAITVLRTINVATRVFFGWFLTNLDLLGYYHYASEDRLKTLKDSIKEPKP